MNNPTEVIHIVQRVEAGVQRLASQAETSFTPAEQAIRRSEEALLRMETNLERELDTAQHALKACLNSTDEDGNPYDCSAYSQEVYALEDQLRQTRQVHARLDEATLRFRADMSSMQNILAHDIPAALYWLHDRESALVRFEGMSG